MVVAYSTFIAEPLSVLLLIYYYHFIIIIIKLYGTKLVSRNSSELCKGVVKWNDKKGAEDRILLLYDNWD